MRAITKRMDTNKDLVLSSDNFGRWLLQIVNLLIRGSTGQLGIGERHLAFGLVQPKATLGL